MDLIDFLIKEGWLKTPEIIEAFRKIKREDFMAGDIKHLAEINEALPIGYGQTISQPLVVAFMLEQLKPKTGMKILDVGSGSGWTAALLSYIISQQSGTQNLNLKTQNLGKVVAIELILELKEFGEQNVSKYNFIEKGIAEFICADGSKGYEKEAPFDRILASASLQGNIPEMWKKQLKIKGRIVAPIKSSIWVFKKKSESKFEEKEYPGFVFVPLLEKQAVRQ